MAIIQDKKQKQNAIINASPGKMTVNDFIDNFKELHSDDVIIIVDFYKAKDSKVIDVDSCLLDYFRETLRKKQQHFTDYHLVYGPTRREKLSVSTNINELKKVAYDRSNRNYNMRVAVVGALGKINTGEAKDILRYMTSDPLKKIRREAYKMLNGKSKKKKSV